MTKQNDNAPEGKPKPQAFPTALALAAARSGHAKAGADKSPQAAEAYSSRNLKIAAIALGAAIFIAFAEYKNKVGKPWKRKA